MSTFNINNDGTWGGGKPPRDKRAVDRETFWADAKKAIKAITEGTGLSRLEAKNYTRAARMLALWLKACVVARKAIGTPRFERCERRAHKVYAAMPLESKMAIYTADIEDDHSAYVVVNLGKDGKVQSFSRSPGVIMVVRREGEDGQWIG